MFFSRRDLKLLISTSPLELIFISKEEIIPLFSFINLLILISSLELIFNSKEERIPLLSILKTRHKQPWFLDPVLMLKIQLSK